jgi:predicted small secreted protein
MIKKLLRVILLIFMMFSVTGCQTVQGLGGDIKWVGQKSGKLLEGK